MDNWTKCIESKIIDKKWITCRLQCLNAENLQLCPIEKSIIQLNVGLGAVRRVVQSWSLQKKEDLIGVRVGCVYILTSFKNNDFVILIYSTLAKMFSLDSVKCPRHGSCHVTRVEITALCYGPRGYGKHFRLQSSMQTDKISAIQEWEAKKMASSKITIVFEKNTLLDLKKARTGATHARPAKKIHEKLASKRPAEKPHE